MSRRDENSDSAVEGLLQSYERAEAVVLREELTAFLESDECRTVLAETVRKPVESIVRSALADPKFQEQVRDAVIKSLQPELVKAVRSAAADALKDVKVELPEGAQARMRRDAEQLIRDAMNAPQKTALATPSGHDDVRRGALLRNRILLGVGVLAFLAVAYGIFSFTKNQRVDSVDQPAASLGATTSDTDVPTETARPAEPQPSRLLATYRGALAQAGPPNLPAVSASELSCVADAVDEVERSAALDVAALRTALNQCAATKGRPTTASRIIATVQAQITEESRGPGCGALQPVTIDGRHGTETSKALRTYVGCTSPVGVPQTLETLGDYAAVGVYFVHKRMRDAG